MSKKEVKPETAEPTNEPASSNSGDQNNLSEPYSEKTALGGPIFSSYGTMACRTKLSGKILEASGLRANDRVEMVAGDGQILIKKIGDRVPGLPTKSTKSGMDRALDALMTMTKEHEAKLRADRERLQAYREEAEADEEGETLSEEQLGREEL